MQETDFTFPLSHRKFFSGRNFHYNFSLGFLRRFRPSDHVVDVLVHEGDVGRVCWPIRGLGVDPG